MLETVIKQHLIDPEICIRCNTCEAICPVGAITHDSRNYVVKADVCNLCMDCRPNSRPMNLRRLACPKARLRRPPSRRPLQLQLM